MILRRAANYEYYMSLYHGQFPMNFTTTALLEGPLELNQLKHACKMLQQRHPLLRAKVIFNEHGDPYMCDDDVPEISIEVMEVEKGCTDIERNDDPHHWTAVAERELLNFLDLKTGPFVRFFWLREKGSSKSALLLYCDHISFDGVSAAVIMEDLLHYVENPQLSVESYPILPGITELLKDEVAQRCEKYFFETEKPGFEKYCRDYEEKIAKEGKPEEKPKEKKEHKLNLTAWKLDKEQSGSLVKACKSHGITVHTALGLALLQSFYKVEGPEERTERILQFPVSAKSFFKEDITGKLGCNMDLAVIPVNLEKDTDFWTKALELKELIKKKLDDPKLFSEYYWGKHYLDNTDNVKEFFESLPPWDAEEENEKWEFSLSNIGVQKFRESYGDLKLRGFFGPTFSGVFEKVIGVNSTNGEMFFTLICGADLMKRETLNEIKDLTVKILMDVVSE